jgi:hypothetical protein
MSLNLTTETLIEADMNLPDDRSGTRRHGKEDVFEVSNCSAPFAREVEAPWCAFPGTAPARMRR